MDIVVKISNRVEALAAASAYIYKGLSTALDRIKVVS
jgi:hypothetical protein